MTRRPPPLRACAALAACTLLALGAQPAHAQPAADDLPDAPPDEYMTLIQEAVHESAAEHWVEARSLFREAQRVHPNARALRGVGMTSFELRDYTAAHRALSAALADTRRALDFEQRAQVEALLRRVHGLIARYTVAHLGDGAAVTVDAVLQELDQDGYVLMPAGRHSVAVTLSDGRRVQGSWTVRGGELGPLPIEVPAEAPTPPHAAEAEAPSPEPLAQPTPNPLPPPRDRSAAWGWTAVAAGASAGIVGAALTRVGRSDRALLEQPPVGTVWDDVAGLRSRGPRFARTGAALLLVGAGSLAAGVTLVVRARRRDADEQVYVTLAPNGGRVGVTW